MSFFSNLFSSDQQLTDIDKQIEGVISSVPIKDYNTGTETDLAPSELIHQLLASEERFVDKDQLKKNPFFSELGDTSKSGIMTDVGTLLDKLTVQADRASRYKT